MYVTANITPKPIYFLAIKQACDGEAGGIAYTVHLEEYQNNLNSPLYLIYQEGSLVRSVIILFGWIFI